MNNLSHPVPALPNRDRLIVSIGAIAGGAILLALVRGIASGAVIGSSVRSLWLTLHLLTVLPALPLGAYVLLRPKGNGAHRALGRLWGVMMLLAALSSFGLGSKFSLIHLLSVLVLIAVPRAVMLARRHRTEAHRRAMSLTYLGLAVAGLFTLLPGRLLGSWLFS